MKKYSILDIKEEHLFESDLRRENSPVFDKCFTNTAIINLLEDKGVLRGNFTQQRHTPDDTGVFSLYFNAAGEAESFVERLNIFLEEQSRLAVQHSIELGGT